MDNAPESLLNELNKLENLRDPDKGQGSHQRQFKRFVIRGDAELVPVGRGKIDLTPIDIKLRDIGRGGIGFICERDLPANSSWRVNFLNQGYPVGHQALIVRHTRRVGNDLYLVGAQFVIETGLLVMLGVDPAQVHNEQALNNNDDDDGFSFLPPAEVA